jgi:hypothetical protein
MADITKTKHKNLGISISEPSDMSLWGITPSHIKDAMIEVGRYAINYGYKLSYGGDLNYGGFINFSEVLMEIVLRYGDPDFVNKSGEKYVTNYIDSYLSEKMSNPIENTVSKFTNIVYAPAPDNTMALNEYVKDSALYKSLSLSSMRQFMNDRINARILIGGKYFGFTGVLPGVLEEAYLALRTNKPLYLIGGFGGCTRKIIELIKGNKPIELTLNYQLQHDENKRQLMDAYDRFDYYRSSELTYKTIPSFFNETLRFNNGLNCEDNHILFETRNIKEAIYLLFKGLDTVFKEY